MADRNPGELISTRIGLNSVPKILNRFVGRDDVGVDGPRAFDRLRGFKREIQEIRNPTIPRTPIELLWIPRLTELRRGGHVDPLNRVGQHRFHRDPVDAQRSHRRNHHLNPLLPRNHREFRDSSVILRPIPARIPQIQGKPGPNAFAVEMKGGD